MIDLQAIVAFNSAAVLLLLVILLNSRTALKLQPFDGVLFRFMALSAIVQAIIETVTFFATGVAFPGAYWFNMIINDLLYINNILFTFLWTLYVDYKLFGDVQRLKKRYLVVGIPALLIVLASIANLFCPVFFTVDKVTFEYARTNLFFIPILSSAFYLYYGLFLTCKYKSQNRQYLFFPVLIFLIPITLALITEFFFYGLNVLWIGAAISLTSIYINLQNQINYTDSLSGLFTRQYLASCIQSELKKSTSTGEIAGIMLDIDKFKLINDTYGHLAGDEAIREAGKILRHALPPGAKAFRFGGDEFVLIQTISDEREALDSIERIRALSEEFNGNQKNSYRLSFSIGYAVYDRSADTFDQFLQRMDAAMYQDKKASTL